MVSRVDTRRGTRTGRWVAALVAVLAAGLLLGSTASAAAQDGAAIRRAGLVVRHGDGRLTYAFVPFREETISGIDLLRRSGIEHVTIPFGGLGEGVGALEGEGCPTGECRRRVCQGTGPNAPYWRFFHQVAPGNWQPLALGASATTVRDGDVFGWSWTGEEPGLPAVSVADVARLVGVSDRIGGLADGALPAAAVRTVYPSGVQAEPASNGQSRAAYAVAIGLIALMGMGALYAARRARRRASPPEAPA